MMSLSGKRLFYLKGASVSGIPKKHLEESRTLESSGKRFSSQGNILGGGIYDLEEKFLRPWNSGNVCVDNPEGSPRENFNLSKKGGFHVRKG